MKNIMSKLKGESDNRSFYAKSKALNLSGKKQDSEFNSQPQSFDLPYKMPKSKKVPESFSKQILKIILGKSSYNNEDILGIDITPHYIRICQLKRSYGKLSLKNLASACMESYFRKTDIAINSVSYAENLKALLIKNKINIKDATFTVPSSSSIVKILQFTDMSDDDFHQAAKLGGIWESAVELEGGAGEYQVYYKILKHNPPKEIIQQVTQVPDQMPQQEQFQEQPADEMTLQEMRTQEQPQETLTEQMPTQDSEVVEEYRSPETDLPEAIHEENISSTFEENVEVAPQETSQIIQQDATIEVLFIATKISDVMLYADIIKAAGLKPVLADVRCLALKHALQSKPGIFDEIREPYALLEFGPDDNYVFVVDAERTNIYNIYMSEDDIAALIYNSEDKERIKLFIENYASQALQILQYHQQNHNTDAIIHLFSNSSAPIHVNDASSEPLMKRFVREMKRHMVGREIKECDFCSHIEVPEKFSKQVNAEGNISAWAGVIGIATRKLDILDIQKCKGLANINLSNLLPSYQRDKNNKINSIFSTFIGFGASTVCLAVLASSYLALQTTAQKLEAEVQSMSNVEAKYKVTLEGAQLLTVLVNQIDSLDDVQASLPSNQPGVIASFKHISESYPEGVLLKEVIYQNPSSITINGVSVNDQSILSFIKKINQKSEIMKVALKTMETETKQASNTPSNGTPNSPPSLKNFTLSGTINIINGQEKLVEILKNGGANGN